MTDYLDTSVILRYLIGDTPEPELVRQIVEDVEEIVITDVTLAETAFALTSNYSFARSVAVEALIELVGRDNIDTYPAPKDLVVQALTLCKPSHRVSFADALLWAEARSQRAGVYTLDQRFPSDGIEVLRAPRGAS